MKLLYIAPERLCTERILDFLAEQQISFVAIDEAHCISSWGHQFRPEYRLLGKLRERFPEVDLHAYTATATEQVREDIVKQLQLRSPRLLVGNFDRPNLTYRVTQRYEVRQQIRQVLDRFPDQAGIIYCISRKQVEDLNLYLQQSGYRSAAYHAGMEHQQREQTQNQFLNEKVNIIVATVAFGMGIDKSNVRFVIHASATRSIENYQQETGRAGRDGLPAECYLFYGGQDFATWKKLLSDLRGEAAEVAAEQLRLKSQFCQSLRCRHQLLVEHFGQTYERENCGACDVCLNEVLEVPDSLIISQKILSCVVRVEQRFGGEYVANVLAGSQDQRLLENGHDQLSTYGLLKTHHKKAIRDWIEQLLAQGCLEREEQYGSLRITPTGRQVFREEYRPRLLQTRKTKSHASRQNQDIELNDLETGLFEALRLLRRQIAQEKKLAPFIIFSDVTLVDLSRRRPTTPGHFLQIQGVGRRKCEEYAEPFLAVVKQYASEQKLSVDQGFAKIEEGLEERLSAKTGGSGEAVTGSAIQQQAAALFDQQMSLPEVADRLNRTCSTIVQYLVQYIESRELTSIEPWVKEDVFAQVSQAALGQESGRLKPIYEALEGTVAYDDIRLVLACLKNR